MVSQGINKFISNTYLGNILNSTLTRNISIWQKYKCIQCSDKLQRDREKENGKGR